MGILKEIERFIDTVSSDVADNVVDDTARIYDAIVGVLWGVAMAACDAVGVDTRLRVHTASYRVFLVVPRRARDGWAWGWATRIVGAVELRRLGRVLCTVPVVDYDRSPPALPPARVSG